ncbi:acetyl-CoA carboxylase biotin carboxyl carrier protein [Pseudomonas sp. LRF_L74]|uniref:acetyl-CoA carboxylase biotin carboxyl carrier protein n=1 Tax=Pseudomonas sp. LRF_L74 TaxID=3369422 RepID=UPI003F62147E
MHIDKIRQLASWMAEANLAQLELRSPTFEIRLKRPAQGAAPAKNARLPATPVTADIPLPVAAIATVCGHFHARHPERDTPQVASGQAIKTGDLVGVIDVGDLLLPVIASADGIAGHYLVEDGQLVDYGTALLALSGA